MIVRAGTGWQTLMADLSIILFMVTAAALSQAGPGKVGAAAAAPSPRGEPMAVYRTGAGAPPLGEWLDAQPRDERQLLTLVSTYTPGKQTEALSRAGVSPTHPAATSTTPTSPTPAGSSPTTRSGSRASGSARSTASNSTVTG